MRRGCGSRSAWSPEEAEDEGGGGVFLLSAVSSGAYRREGRTTTKGKNTKREMTTAWGRKEDKGSAPTPCPPLHPALHPHGIGEGTVFGLGRASIIEIGVRLGINTEGNEVRGEWGGKNDARALYPPLKRRRGKGGGKERGGIRALAAGHRGEEESEISSVAAITERGNIAVGAVARIGRAGGGAGVAVGLAQGNVEAGRRRRGKGGMTRRGSGGRGRKTAAETEEGAAAGVLVGIEARKEMAGSDAHSPRLLPAPRLLHLLFLLLSPRHEEDEQTMTEKKRGRRKRR